MKVSILKPRDLDSYLKVLDDKENKLNGIFCMDDYPFGYVSPSERFKNLFVCDMNFFFIQNDILYMGSYISDLDNIYKILIEIDETSPEDYKGFDFEKFERIYYKIERSDKNRSNYSIQYLYSSN